MTDHISFINRLLAARGVQVPEDRSAMIREFAERPDIRDTVVRIKELQDNLSMRWKSTVRLRDVIQLHIPIPNGTVGKHYSARIDRLAIGLEDLSHFELFGLEELGLVFDSDVGVISGVPSTSGEHTLVLRFRLAEESEKDTPHEKTIRFLINPDPRSLWKNIPSDVQDQFWKEDQVAETSPLGDKRIIVASKRGRSHANVGSFRDDDFAYGVNSTGWSIVAVSDGAGSYPLSRVGSRLACNAIIEYFSSDEALPEFKELTNQLDAHFSASAADDLASIETSSKKCLYQGARYAFTRIGQEANATREAHPEIFDSNKTKAAIEYFHSTLIFALFKRFGEQYVIMTFGVGDCPIAIMNKDCTSTELLNWLDVGEFGGGTRFITQAEIFRKEEVMPTRFNFRVVDDFSYLFLMTDGIYDPKFEVEANLQKHECWLAFVEDLKGANEQGVSVDLEADTVEAAHQLSEWMDFWSTGNHDDRTLAIIL